MFDTLSDDSKDALRLVPILLHPYSWTYKINLLCIFLSTNVFDNGNNKEFGSENVSVNTGHGKEKDFFLKKNRVHAHANLNYL